MRQNIFFPLPAVILSGLLLAAPSPALAGPSPWTDDPYSQYAQNTRLDKVLQDFASSFSLSLKLGSGINGIANGRFNTKNPSEFINKLGSVYGFNWFTHAGTLFISRTDHQRTALIPVSGSTTQMREALSSLGILDSRFGWGELPEQNSVLVSGPPAYVDLIERTVKLLPSVAGGQQVAVFRLKHASVEDRVIHFRDKEITTPGLMSILRNLIQGTNSGNNRSGVNNEALAAMVAPLRASPPSISEQTTPSSAGAASQISPAAAGQNVTGNRARTPSVQGDSRLNSLIIQDIPERIPVYERLIRELDVPTSLIEIQAMIVDVNSQRMEELGINWSARSNKVVYGYTGKNISNDNTLSLNWGESKGAVSANSTLVVDSVNFLLTRIRALEGFGDANIRSTPSVLTQDNSGALFDLTQTFYIRIQGERVATVTPVSAGTTLRVTPRVVEEQGQKQINLIVDIEDGRIQEEVTVDTLPTVIRSGISTQALINNNQTMVIGGYNQEQSVKRTDRVPLLGEIPVLGALFSHKSNDRQKRERLFLLKPRIVTLPGPNDAVAPPVTQISTSEALTDSQINPRAEKVDTAPLEKQ